MPDSPDIAKWIKKSFERTKESWEKTKNLKYLLALGKILRSYINQTRDKRAGISVEHKIIGREMVEYISLTVSKQKYNAGKHAQLFQCVANCQYANRHLGESAVIGSALKRKLTPGERRSVRRLVKGNAAGNPLEEQPEDDGTPDHGGLERMGNGSA
jgi:hypothetical protein